MDYSSSRRQGYAQHAHDDWEQVHNDWLGVQKKSLTVNHPEDANEKEADTVAQKVVNGQHAAVKGSSTELNRKADSGGEASQETETKLAGSKGGGRALDDATRGEMESKMGADFSGVRLHTGETAHALNEDVSAKAFTHGQDIYFGKNESPQNKSLLAHELVHTVQQGNGVQRQIQRQCDVDAALEWYKTNAYGKTVVFSPELALQLFDAAGEGAKTEYDQAISENKIGPGFVELVCKAQTALKLGLIDGKFGKGTKKALDNFRTGGAHGIDYNRLLGDKKLDIGVAIGVEFSSEHTDCVKLLEDEKFVKSADTKQKTTYTKKVKLPVPGDDNAAPVEFEIVVDLIYENSENPKDTYASFLAEKDVALYSGHARYGTGPDFDDHDSQAQNFVIGNNSALHKNGTLTPGYNSEMNTLLKDNPNDLEKMSKDKKFDDHYQVWMFNACSSNNYKDEVRGGLVKTADGKKKSSTDLRFFGSTDVVSSDCLPILRGLIKLDSMDDIIKAMNKNENALNNTKDKSYYFAD